ncbi:MAG: ornithine carbamoyltransferase [Dehalococcoidia bacterium]|nr:ornithine carbamoyltransferase [Dehalococcoidia bacterium]
MRTNSFLGRDWIDAELDYTKEEWETLIDVALDLKRKHAMGEDQTHILRGKTLYTMFFNQSLRTRSTFATGIQQLGGFHVDLEPGKTYTPAREGYDIPYKTERIADIARILSRVGDAIAIRMYGPPAYWIYGFANATLKEFAEHAQIPIINMEDDKYHPTQTLADLITIKEKFGTLKGLKLTMSWAYSGSVEKPRAVPQSVVLAATKMGMDVTLAHPKGFELEPAVIDACKEFSADMGGSFKIVNDFEVGFKGADVVYPKAWGSVPCFDFTDESGKTVKQRAPEEAERLNNASKDWMTTTKQMKLTNKNAIYMHCLPADRGQEVTDEVIDGPQSVIVDEAENRLHAHKAIMALIMGGRL